MTAWLRCRLDKGMFSDEVAATYPASSVEVWQTSVFVPVDCVRRESEHEGEVKVSVVVRDGKCFAVLPNAYRDIVAVEDADLRQL